MQKFFQKFIIFGVCSTAFLFADVPSDTTGKVSQPPAMHFVGWASPYLISARDNISALEYCSFLKTEASADYYYLKDDYYDSVFMAESLANITPNVCIIRTGSNGHWKFSVVAGREDYIIAGLTSENALKSFEVWGKQPKLIELRNYINFKIAEFATNQALYAEKAHAIKDSYLAIGSSSDEFDELDLLVFDLLDLSGNPISFDAQGCATICLTSSEIRKSILYFNQNIQAEGDELSNDFSYLPSNQMKICAHLFSNEDRYYRLKKFTRSTIPVTQ